MKHTVDFWINKFSCTQVVLALALGVPVQRIGYWKKRKQGIPPEFVARLEEMAKSPQTPEMIELFQSVRQPRGSRGADKKRRKKGSGIFVRTPENTTLRGVGKRGKGKKTLAKILAGEVEI